MRKQVSFFFNSDSNLLDFRLQEINSILTKGHPCVNAALIWKQQENHEEFNECHGI